MFSTFNMSQNLHANLVIFKGLATMHSGVENGTNRANCDTSTKFGTNVLWRLLVKSARGAT